MKQEEDKFTGLPENAFRELKPGEVYNPLMGPSKNYPEVNIWSVAWGIAMAILFSAAAAYLGLKVGQVFEAAIPIAIIAVGVSGAAKRKNALGENVIIQSIGACSGVIVAGAIFTLPALYILQAKYPEMTVTFMQVFISSLLGGVLGILFLIPFRKYFVSDMHGKYPFPEATATTQVLISGEKGGSQAKPLLMAGMIGGLYDFIVATFGWWNENFTTRVCSAGEMLAEKAKLVFKVNTGAAVLGLGYIVGLKYASIICAGSLAVWWIIIPGMSAIWGDSVLNAWNPEITSTVGMMSPEEIFKYYAKSIGIGGIAMAGVIGIIRSWSIIKRAVGLAAKEMGGKGNVEKSIIRTQRDLSMKIIAIGSIITLILIVLFFYLDVMQGNLLHTLVAIVLVAGISFLFTTVAANAIAIVGTNPVSGMTLMTLILASVVMVAVGLKGPSGMVAALVMGGVLGILFLIPLRKYFVSDMHGKYPFPEATATTQVLISGEKGGSQAKPLLMAGMIGGLYDFIVATFGWWNENFTTRVCSAGEMLAEKAKLVFKVNTGAAVLGLGYIVGLKYASIICAGSLAVWWIIIPGMSAIWGDSVLNAWNPEITSTVGIMSPEEIFKYYAKSIGIGGIAMAGVIGIIRSWSIIKSAVGLAAKEMGGKGNVEKSIIRTQRDLSMKIIAIGSIITLILIVLFFYLDVMQGNLLHTLVAIVLVAGISFLFTTVAANAIAIVGTNPVSGMTLMTLILASVVMVAVGLKGPSGMVAALVMGGVVCTALSMAGGFITDLKIGYWLGSTPAKQETWKFLGTIVSAATVGGVMIILNKTYGFTSGALAAPQANAMAAVIEPLMSGVGAPWLLYGIGAVLAIILTLCKIPALAFALGMFIPLELNVPLVVGGAVNWFVTTRSKDASLNTERGEKGTLLASGFIAGGALMGVISAAMRFGGINLVNEAWLNNTWSEVLALGAYALLILYFIKASMKVK